MLDCILSKNKPTTNGYPRKSYNNKVYYHHRLIWILENGSILEGYDIHHKCGNKCCINIKHLECLKRIKHLKKHGLSGEALKNSKKTHCKCGNILDGVNKKQRFCIKCKRKHQLEYAKRNREKINNYKRFWRLKQKGEIC